VFRLTRPEASHSGPEPLAHYTSDPVAASGSGYSAPSREDCLYTPANATTDDSGPPSQSILCARGRRGWTPMDGTKQTKSWVIGGVRTGGLPAMTDGF
jgi:hypothetical protein